MNENKLSLPMLVIQSLVISACSFPHASSDGPVAHASAAEAINCASACKAVKLSLALRNDSDQDFCISAQYTTAYSTRFVILLDENENPLSYDIYDPPKTFLPDSTNSEKEKIAVDLQARENIRIKSHSDLVINLKTGDDFKIIPGKYKVFVRFYTYPCEVPLGGKSGFKFMNAITQMIVN